MNIDPTPPLSFIFSGSIPQHYEQCLGPMFFEPYAIEVANRIESSSIRLALEIASGTGRVTRHLRNVLPREAKLIASDISVDMLSVAKEKLRDLDIEWSVINAEQLPFDDNSVDLVVCCFGYMFVPDKMRAFSEVYRVLRPGRMFLFTTWDKLELNAVSNGYRQVAKRYLEDPLPQEYNLPFSIHDEEIITSWLQDTGFSKIKIERVKKVSRAETAKQAVAGLTQGGLIYDEIMKRNPAWMDEIKTIVEQELAEKYGAAPMTASMSAVISEAWKS